jgi:SAM-dependent methyltransferase
MADRAGYLARMAKPLQEKLRIAKYLPWQGAILDVGCADGVVTRALAHLLPQAQLFGIDLDGGFIEAAATRTREEGLVNARFARVYLRELLARPERFHAVTFCSVLHEFFTYGEGISSVLKALADAHELLVPGGVIVIRDMVLYEYAKHATFGIAELRREVEARLPAHVVTDFTRAFGPPETLYVLNHLLLKYWYAENWTRESTEFYVPVTFEEYEQVFCLLGMTTHVAESSTLPFLLDKWATDFGFTSEQLSGFRSTGILVAQKPLR